jgi:cytosine deaminase
MLRAARVLVFAGNDDIRDTWSPYGTGDLLERAAVIGWKGDFRRDAQVEIAFDLISAAGAQALGKVGNPPSSISCGPAATSARAAAERAALQRADLGKATTRSVGRAKLVKMKPKPKQIQRLDGLFGYDSDTHVRADAR